MNKPGSEAAQEALNAIMSIATDMQRMRAAMGRAENELQRHGLAAMDLQIGDVIVVENPGKVPQFAEVIGAVVSPMPSGDAIIRPRGVKVRLDGKPGKAPMGYIGEGCWRKATLEELRRMNR